MKTCTKCGVEKPESEFHRNGSRTRPDCKLCACARSSAWYSSNTQRALALAAEYRQKNAAQKKARDRKWYRNNRDLVLARNQTPAVRAARKAAKTSWDAANKDHNREKRRQWTEDNRGRANGYVKARRAAKLCATPAWRNDFFIEEAYDLAVLRTKVMGFPWHVDHIVPLRSKLVCGLHVEHNLAVIPALHNFSKGNRHWPDMP